VSIPRADYECDDPTCACHQRAWIKYMDRLEQEVFPDSIPRADVIVEVEDDSA
jgi:hypothetical protein